MKVSKSDVRSPEQNTNPGNIIFIKARRGHSVYKGEGRKKKEILIPSANSSPTASFSRNQYHEKITAISQHAAVEKQPQVL